MNIHKHEKSGEYVRVLKYRNTIGYCDILLGECDYKIGINIGSINCKDVCSCCREHDNSNNIIYCSYIDSELEKQKKLVESLKRQLHAARLKLDDTLEEIREHAVQKKDKEIEKLKRKIRDLEYDPFTNPCR